MPETEHTQLWGKCLDLIRDNIPAEQFNAWFKDITSLKYENDTLVLLVPSAFFAEQLEQRFISILAAVLRRVYGPKVELFYQYLQVLNQSET